MYSVYVWCICVICMGYIARDVYVHVFPKVRGKHEESCFVTLISLETEPLTEPEARVAARESQHPPVLDSQSDGGLQACHMHSQHSFSTEVLEFELKFEDLNKSSTQPWKLGFKNSRSPEASVPPCHQGDHNITPNGGPVSAQ